jgi:uncharacterized cupredoxin-like copper-binding protein
MSTTTDHEPDTSTTDLSDELHALEAQEAGLERRTRSLELAGPLALIFSFVALAVGIGALVVAFGNGSDTNTTPTASTAGGATPGTMMGSATATSRGMKMGAGGHGRFSASQVAAAAKGTVFVQLGDYWAAPTVPAVHAGKVTFVASNVGRVPHELMVERMPIKFESPMHPNEAAAQGMIADMDPGRSGRMTMRLRPGTYMLFCNAPGHYVAGQHITFNVTKS